MITTTNSVESLATSGLVLLVVSLVMLCGCLAGLASKGNERAALQIALVHLLFNLTGIAIFYPVPLLRLPVKMAARLGEITSQYRWFSLLYLLLMFFVFPAVIFGLSLAGSVALFVVLIPVAVVILLVLTISMIQKHKPSILPEMIRTWDFLPEPLRSLDPLDRIIGKLNCLKLCRKSSEMSKPEIDLETATSSHYNNTAYQHDIA